MENILHDKGQTFDNLSNNSCELWEIVDEDLSKYILDHLACLIRFFESSNFSRNRIDLPGKSEKYLRTCCYYSNLENYAYLGVLEEDLLLILIKSIFCNKV